MNYHLLLARALAHEGHAQEAEEEMPQRDRPRTLHQSAKPLFDFSPKGNAGRAELNYDSKLTGSTEIALGCAEEGVNHGRRIQEAALRAACRQTPRSCCMTPFRANGINDLSGLCNMFSQRR